MKIKWTNILLQIDSYDPPFSGMITIQSYRLQIVKAEIRFSTDPTRNFATYYPFICLFLTFWISGLAWLLTIICMMPKNEVVDVHAVVNDIVLVEDSDDSNSTGSQ